MKKFTFAFLSLFIFFSVFSFSERVSASESVDDIMENIDLIQSENEINFLIEGDVTPFKGKKPGYNDGDGAFELGFITANGLLFSDYTQWHEGSFDFPAMSLVYHFNKHGKEVGADTAASYLNKAIEFRRTAKKGVKPSYVSGEVEGTQRYRKNGRYIDLAPNGKIVSFGSTN
ncbi:hypothetical protein P9B03_08925 [Metasolibacillus meyeri]|uniref:Uncharacterized protein n=1 Tax=Metasolibacillus meyeri TaxID=1071052 RepID=A0AAW9NRN2_9BACL|nr:hypothetical protein [Metasolibacillus meyeri]MEC1178603.1 hypothetical protein [Metasolibacillus meyeri]